jgi:hypothetical protein
VLSNDPIIVQFGIFLHLRDAPLHYLDPDYWCSLDLRSFSCPVPVVPLGDTQIVQQEMVQRCVLTQTVVPLDSFESNEVFTWNFVDALMYCYIFGLYGPSVGAVWWSACQLLNTTTVVQ